MRKRLYKRLLDAKLQTKLCSVFLVIFLMSMTCILVLSSILLRAESIKNSSQKTEQILKEAKRNLDYIILDMENMSRFIISESTAQNMLLEGKGTKAYEAHCNQMREILANLASYKPYIESIGLYNLDGDGISIGFGPALTRDYRMLENQGWLQEVFEAKGMYCWEWAKFEDLSLEKNFERLILTRVVNRQMSQQPVGILTLTLNQSYLENMLSQIYLGNQTALTLTTANKDIIFSTEEEKAGAVSEVFAHKNDNTFIIREGLTESLLHYEIADDAGWILYSKTPMKEINRDFLINLQVIIFAAILTIALAFYFYKRFAKTITKPISDVMHAMRRMECANFKEQIPVDREDEIGTLVKSFNSMTGQINILVNEVYKEKLHSKQAELESLQAQINPHFLYNTLECINWKALAHGEKEISQMILALSEMFRFNLSGKTKETSLSEEIQNIRNYLLLQKKRFQDKLDFFIDIPDELLEIRVLKFTLQPLVENSIHHGVGNIEGNGKVYIIGEDYNEEIRLYVIDNGNGIDEELMKRILNGEERGSQTRGHGKGVFNVNERIKLHFGEEYGLTYENMKTGGTRVTVRIPKKGEGCNAECIDRR